MEGVTGYFVELFHLVGRYVQEVYGTGEATGSPDPVFLNVAGGEA